MTNAPAAPAGGGASEQQHHHQHAGGNDRRFAFVPAGDFALLKLDGGLRAFAILALLRMHQGKADVCYPAVETLAAEAGCSARAVIDALTLLAAQGYIARKRRRGAAALTSVLNVQKAAPLEVQEIALPEPVGAESCTSVSADSLAQEVQDPAPPFKEENNQRKQPLENNSPPAPPSAAPPAAAGAAGGDGQGGLFGGDKQQHDKRRQQRNYRALSASDLPLPEAVDTPEIRELWPKRLRQLAGKRQALNAESATEALAELAEIGACRAAAALRHTIRKNFIGLVEPSGGNGKHFGRNPGAEHKDSILARATGVSHA